MKVVQLNIWMGRLMRQIIPFIQAEQPDIICMQEVFSCPDKIAIPDTTYNSLELIMAQGYPYHYFSPIFSSIVERSIVSYGSAIVSKFPLTNLQTIFTSGKYVANHTGLNHVHNTHNLQMVQVELPDGQALSIANHHGYWHSDPIGTDQTIASMELVKRSLLTLPQPLIFCGDLNVSPKSPAMRLFDNWLEDLTDTHRLQSTLSELGKIDNVACDHILTGQQITVKNFYASPALVSDHKALVLEFDIA